MTRTTAIFFCALMLPTAAGNAQSVSGLRVGISVETDLRAAHRPPPTLHRASNDYRLAGAIVGGLIGASMLAVSEGIDSGAEAPRRAATFFFGMVAFVAAGALIGSLIPRGG